MMTRPMCLRLRAAGLFAGGALLALSLARPASAQITIDPTTAPNDAVWVTGNAWSGHATNPVKNADGVISYFYGKGWIEIPFTVDSPGLYQLAVPVASPEPNLKAQIHVRPTGSDDFWASPDVSVPTTGDWGAFQDVLFTDIPILQAGNYILRFANTKLQHHTADNREPGYENDPGVDGPGTGAPRNTGFNFGIMTLTRTGNLPAGTATIAGTVSAATAGIPVVGAWVMASQGDLVGEPGPMWQKGFWTRSGAGGAYSMPVLAGTYNVQAGQPSMYAYAGALQADVTVPAGQTQTVPLNLTSRWTTNENNRLTVQVESEYFENKNPDTFSASPGAYNPSPVVIQGRPVASNGMNVGYVDVDNWVEIAVDLPAGQGGEYTVEDLYFNGFWNGVDYPDAITRFTANPGTADQNAIEAVEPNTTPQDEFGGYLGPPDTGYNVRGSLVFPEPLVLREGHNIIRITSAGTPGVNASAAWDAFILTQVNVPVVPAGAARALKVAAGLEAAPAGAAFDALNVVATGESATRIDIADAVALVKDGKL